MPASSTGQCRARHTAEQNTTEAFAAAGNRPPQTGHRRGSSSADVRPARAGCGTSDNKPRARRPPPVIPRAYDQH
ncbi:hypothetical protein BG844_11625 [Couchioplanes caeruleus subsp. caeruleus]|uniref:Uncharacterized protein n=1 Tax=Couchioplanes caeruleus subsp. caeruleus TaxID=56427 RepID=A0A1K0FMN2_9ACTN|nr:hypothetical protein BG844_11625 [Couchioplanes caeruleus subsp. caeruleus]